MLIHHLEALGLAIAFAFIVIRQYRRDQFTAEALRIAATTTPQKRIDALVTEVAALDERIDTLAAGINRVNTRVNMRALRETKRERTLDEMTPAEQVQEIERRARERGINVTTTGASE